MALDQSHRPLATRAEPTRAVPRGASDRAPLPVSVRTATIAVLLVCAAVALLGLFNTVTGRFGRVLGLDSEITLHPLRVPVPVIASVAMLVAAGAAWGAAARGEARRSVRWARGGLAGLLVFMAADEALVLHERFEKTLAVDWQVLYLPLVAFAGVVGLMVFLGEVWARRAGRSLLPLGAAAWVLAQVLEKIEWQDGVEAPGYAWYVLAEEVLELTGSGLFAIAGVAAVTALAARRRAGSSPD